MPWLDWAFATQKAALKARLSIAERLEHLARAADHASDRRSPRLADPQCVNRQEATHAPRSRLRQAFRHRRADLQDRGVEVDYQPDLGKDKDKLLAVIGQYDGLAIRSATKVTEKLIAAATKLKVIGRAGIGVDNVDIPAATRARHHRDEHALRQFDHHRRACHRA